MRKIINWIIDTIIICSPNWWIMLGDYSESWDIEINQLMDNYKFEEICFEFIDSLNVWEAKLGPYNIWISNYPYASFIDPKYPVFKMRPSKRTILRAKRRLKMDSMPIDEIRNLKLNKLGI